MPPQTPSQMHSQMPAQMHSQMPSQMHSQMPSQMQSQMQSQPLKNNNVNHGYDSEPIQGRSFKVLQQITEPKSKNEISFTNEILRFIFNSFKTKLLRDINILYL